MTVFRLCPWKYITNKYGALFLEDPVIAHEIWSNAFSMGEVYYYRLNYNSWVYFLSSIVKPVLNPSFKHYIKNHRATIFINVVDK